MPTSIGQVLVNEILPPKYQDYKRTLGAKELESMLAQIASEDPSIYKDVSAKLMRLGNKAAYESGTTLRLSDILPPFDKSVVLKQLNAQEDKIRANPKLSDEQKSELLEDLYDKINDLIKEQTYETSAAVRNPFAMQVKSKARGNKDQLAAMISTPGIYSDSHGKVVPMFIQHSYAEGLTPAEYWAGSFGARLGVVSCLTPDTLVLMADFSKKPIGSIRPGDMVMGANKQGEIYPTKVVRFYDNGTQPVYRYTFRKMATKDFVTVDSTEAHKLLARTRRFGSGGKDDPLSDPELTAVGCGKIHKDTSQNNYVAQVVRGQKICSSCKHVDEALLLGLFIGDGCTSKTATGRMSFSCADKSLVDDTKEYLESLGLVFVKSAGNNYNWRLNDIHKTNRRGPYESKGRGFNNKSKAFLWDHIGNCLSHEKSLPDDIYSWDDTSLINLIAGLVATDGSFYLSGKRSNWSFSIDLNNKGIIQQLKEIFELRLGIWCSAVHVTRHNNRRDMYGFAVNHPDSFNRLKDLLAGKVPGIKNTTLGNATAIKKTRTPDIGFKMFSKEFLGNLPVVDIEVESDDHMFVLANGIISSNSKFATAQGGYLGKLLDQAAIDEVVTEDDCGGAYGMPVQADDTDNIGAVLQRGVAGFDAGTVIDKDVLAELKKQKVDEIIVRSPTTCACKNGVCSKCCGIRETGGFPPIGYNLGINAASALSERIAQGALNVKHSGKKSGGKSSYSGFDAIKNMTTVPGTYKDAAVVAKEDGKVTEIDKAPQGGYYVYVGDQKQYVKPGYDLLVKEGDELEAGDQISDGVLNPADVVNYKGIGEGRRYFTNRFTQMMRDSNYAVNRRNVEAVARALVNHVQVDDEDAEAQMLPGDITTYSSWSFGYKPRPNTKYQSPKQAIGQYLESPVLHYTIGTKISRKTAKDLEKYGVTQIFSNPNPVAVTPVMQSVVKSTGDSDDWMARLGTTYLKTRLTEDAQHGAKSNLHSTNPFPGVAKGVEFGNYFDPGVKRTGGYTY